MNLRQKTAACVVVSVACLVGATLWVVDGLVMRELERVERTEMARKVADVQSIVGRCTDEYGESFADWSQWDDLAQFLVDGNQAFLDSNVSLSALAEQIHADFFVVQRDDGTRVFATEVSAARDALQPLSGSIVEHLTDTGLMRAGPAFAGLLACPDRTYIVSSRPVTRSDGTAGEAGGRLVTGELLNPAWVARLRGFTFLELGFTRTAETPYEEEELAAREELAAGARCSVTATNDEHMSGYGLLPDVYGRPALVLHVHRDREIRAHGLEIVRWTMTTLLAGGLLLTVFALWVASRGLIRPLHVLLAGTHKLQRGERTQVIVRTHDELQELARAFNAMSDAIAEREEALRGAHEEIAGLLDGMAQAIVAFGPDGRIAGRASRRAHEVFGRAELAGVSLRELLYPGADEFDLEAEAFQAWLAVAFTQPVESWPELCELAPRQALLRAGSADETHLALEFRALEVEGRVQRVILLATDETEKVRLRRTQAEREGAHERQLQAMRKLLAGGAQVFVSFVRSGRERLDELAAILAARPERLDAADVELLFRHAHTLKGEARVFDIAPLEQAARELEDQLEELRAEARRGPVDAGLRRPALERAIASARTELARAEELFVRASPIGEAILDQMAVRRSDVEALEQLTERLVAELGSSLVWAVHDLVERIHSRPFGEIACPLGEHVPQWAQKLGKRARLEIEGREVPIPAALARQLPGVLTHLVRNALAHGIEPPEQRERAGKEPLGRIRLAARLDDCGPRLTIEDDGAGLDTQALLARARELGLSSAAGEESGLIFVPGLSTAARVDDHSGRGVGMQAVRADLAAAGYEIEVESRRGAFTRFELRLRSCSLNAAPRPASPAGKEPA